MIINFYLIKISYINKLNNLEKNTNNNLKELKISFFYKRKNLEINL